MRHKLYNYLGTRRQRELFFDLGKVTVFWQAIGLRVLSPFTKEKLLFNLATRTTDTAKGTDADIL